MVVYASDFRATVQKPRDGTRAADKDTVLARARADEEDEPAQNIVHLRSLSDGVCGGNGHTVAWQAQGTASPRSVSGVKAEEAEAEAEAEEEVGRAKGSADTEAGGGAAVSVERPRSVAVATAFAAGLTVFDPNLNLNSNGSAQPNSNGSAQPSTPPATAKRASVVSVKRQD